MKALYEYEAKKLLRKYGIPTTREFLARTKDDAKRHAKKIGYPIVLKIQSPDILHKTDAGGVVVGIGDEKELEKAFDKIMENAKNYEPNARIEGILVQEMVSDDGIRECIIGSKKDPQFGPVIMFGLGGIFVEVFKDVSFRIIPIERKDAKEMISEIKSYKILKGVRGQKSVDFESLESSLLNVSKMVWENQCIEELDINPLFVSPKGVKAVDARIIMK